MYYLPRFSSSAGNPSLGCVGVNLGVRSCISCLLLSPDNLESDLVVTMFSHFFCNPSLGCGVTLGVRSCISCLLLSPDNLESDLVVTIFSHFFSSNVFFVTFFLLLLFSLKLLILDRIILVFVIFTAFSLSSSSSWPFLLYSELARFSDSSISSCDKTENGTVVIETITSFKLKGLL